MAEETKFKVGDRVRVVYGDELTYFKTGDYAKLVKYYGGYWWGLMENAERRAGDVRDNTVCLTQYGQIELAEPAPIPASILTEAHELVNGDRAKAYGDVHENFQRWSDLLRPLDIVLTPYELALVMVAGKMARQSHRAKRDNLVDAAGYLELANRLLPPEPAK